MEWEAVTKNQIEGCRVKDPENFEAFAMRKQSVYANWTAEMLKSRIHDLHRMKDNRWNPEITAVKHEIVEEIVKVQKDWLEEAFEKNL